MVHFRIRKAQERKATRAEKLAMKEQNILLKKSFVLKQRRITLLKYNVKILKRMCIITNVCSNVHLRSEK